MEIGDLYQYVLLVVLVGMVLGVGVITLDKFKSTTGITANANSALGNFTTYGLMPIATDWISLITTVAVLAIILYLVIRSFANKR